MKQFTRIIAGEKRTCYEAIRPGMIRLKMNATFGDGAYNETTVMLIPSDMPDKAIQALHDFWCSEKERELNLVVGYSCNGGSWSAGFSSSEWDNVLTDMYDHLISKATAFFKNSTKTAASLSDTKSPPTLADEMEAILKLVKSLNGKPGESIGYTMADGKHHLFIYVDDNINNHLQYVIEPNRIDDGGGHVPMDDVSTVRFRDYGSLICECLRMVETLFAAPNASRYEHKVDEVTLSTYPDDDHFFSKEFTVSRKWLSATLSDIGYDESIEEFLDGYTWDDTVGIFELATKEAAITLVSQGV